MEVQNGVNEADKDEWADVDDGDDEEDPAEDDDDDEGWITPSNFSQKRLEMFGVEASKKPEVVKVACMTTDFAMQVRSFCTGIELLLQLEVLKLFSLKTKSQL